MSRISSSPSIYNRPQPVSEPPPPPPPPSAIEPPATDSKPLEQRGSGPRLLRSQKAQQRHEELLRSVTFLNIPPTQETQRTVSEAMDVAPSSAVVPPLAVENAEPVAKTTNTTTPTADPQEIAALELLLADPSIQEMIAYFGGPHASPASGNPVADSLIERYGADLVVRLNQLQTARKIVHRLYLDALDAALFAPRIVGQSGWSPFGEDKRLDPYTFTIQWLQSDGPRQRVWRTLYGNHQGIPSLIANGESTETMDWDLAGQHLKLIPPHSDEGGSGPGYSHLSPLATQINPQSPSRDLINPEWVWFDPQYGWITDSKNFQKNRGWFEQFITVASTFIAGYITGGAAASYGAFAQGVAAAAAGSVASQLTTTGRLNFKNIIQSALAGGFTAGAMKISGLGTAANTFSQRLIQHTGRATLQGAIQKVIGGKFKDGVVNGLMSGVADEVGTLLRTEIDHMKNLSATEASALRLLSRATTSALRIAANPEDKGYAFASDFLASILQDGVEPSDNTETAVETAIERSAGSRFDDEVVGERDSYFIDITSMVGKELAAQADKGFALLKAQIEKGGYEFLAREVYFQPDGKGMGYIKIDGVFIDNKDKDNKGVVFGEAKMGNADLTKNQKSGLPMLREGKGTFYGKDAAIVAKELGLKPDANGRFRIPTSKILDVYVVTFNRTAPRSKRMNQFNNLRIPFIRGGGI